MNDLTFANGAVYDCTFCALNPVDNLLFIELTNVSFVEAATIFSDEQITKEIHIGENIYLGYTKLLDLSIHELGIQAALKHV